MTETSPALQARGDGPEIGPDPQTGSNLAELLDNVQADLSRVLYDYCAQVWNSAERTTASAALRQ